MITGEINVISQPGRQFWPGMAWTRSDILAGRIRPGQIFKIQPGQEAWPGRPPGAWQAPGQAGSSVKYLLNNLF
jgi:hypothetical protein